MKSLLPVAGEMILLSRIIKFKSPDVRLDHSKVIEVQNYHLDNQEEIGEPINLQINIERQQLLKDAEREASLLIQQAQSKAIDIINEAERQRHEWDQEKVKLSSEAYEEGFQSGVLEGRETGHSEYASLIEVAKQITEKSKLAYVEHVDHAEGTILDLAIATAERILHLSLDDDREKFVPLVKRALKEAREFKNVEVHVHPINYELLIAEKAALDAIFPNDMNCYVYPDIDLEENACYIESENGRIDASITSQLLELKQSLTSLLKEESR